MRLLKMEPTINTLWSANSLTDKCISSLGAFKISKGWELYLFKKMKPKLNPSAHRGLQLLKESIKSNGEAERPALRPPFH